MSRHPSPHRLRGTLRLHPSSSANPVHPLPPPCFSLRFWPRVWALLLGSFCWAIAVAGSASAQEKAQFAVLDYAVIFRDYFRAVESKQRFEKKQDELKKDMEERENSVNLLMKDAKKLQEDLQSPALSETKKKEITGQLKDKLTELDGRQRMAMDFRNQSLMVLQKSQANEQESLMADITKALSTVAKNKYSIVFAKSSIPFSEGIDDITQQVLTLLNKDAPAASKKEEKK